MSDDVVFNKQQLMTMSGDDEELAAQVAGIFLDDIPKQLAALEEAIADGDLKTAERVAHSIKGASATLGGEALRTISYDGECQARDGKTDLLPGTFLKIKEKYEELEQALLAANYERMDPDA